VNKTQSKQNAAMNLAQSSQNTQDTLSNNNHNNAAGKGSAHVA